MTNSHSSRILRNCKAANSARPSAARMERELAEMKAGPRLEHDRIIVPSFQYNAAAAEFWALHGFRWYPVTKTWERDTNLVYNQKNYRPECWLESTRREYFKFWPTLAEQPAPTPAQVQAAVKQVTVKYTQLGSGTVLDERHYQGNWR